MAYQEVARDESGDPHADHFEIEIEVPGWTRRLAVPLPAQPGAVRGAVEKMLVDLGLVRT